MRSELEEKARERGAEFLDGLVGSARAHPKNHQATTPPDAPAEQQDGSADDDDVHGGDPKRQSAAKELIAIGLTCELFHDDRGDAYGATTDASGVRRTLRLRGRDFRRWLASRLYSEKSIAASGEAFSAAISVLEARAHYNGPLRTLHNRFARLGVDVWIDMCDSKCRALKVTGQGWSVEENPPILFRRYSHQSELPDPERGGDLNTLRGFLNLKRDDDWLLIRAWLVAAMVADIPRPVILFHGAQGSAKSTAASMLRALVDPSACDNIDLGRDPSALAQALDHHSVPFFDNLSAITKWQADLLCKAVTGGGFMKRELYSDSEDILMAFRRAIILTGVNVPTHQPDLLDRTILVELERVSSDKRLRDRDIWERFESERPKILGALLDELVGALREHKHVQLDKLPRMADYAVLGAAASEANGTGKDAFMAALAANSERQTAEVIESDPLGAAIIALMKNRDEWSGSNVSELMKAIDPGDPKPEGWPKGARSAACRLRLLQSALFDVGLRVTFERGGKNRTRTVSIRKFASFASFASADSVNPCFNRGPMADAKRTQNSDADFASASNILFRNGKDEADAKDAKMRTPTSAEIAEQAAAYKRQTEGW